MLEHGICNLNTSLSCCLPLSAPNFFPFAEPRHPDCTHPLTDHGGAGREAEGGVPVPRKRSLLLYRQSEWCLQHGEMLQGSSGAACNQPILWENGNAWDHNLSGWMKGGLWLNPEIQAENYPQNKYVKFVGKVWIMIAECWRFEETEFSAWKPKVLFLSFDLFIHLATLSNLSGKALEVNQEVNCVIDFIHGCEDQLQKLKKQKEKGLLYGIPVSIKDHIDCKVHP